MSNLAHYFIAVPLTKEIKDIFSNWQLGLKKQLAYKQWPHKEDLHITLKFLGPAEKNKLNNLAVSLETLKTIPEFSVRTGTLNFFGNPDNPRVLWAGVEQTNELMQLHQSIEHIARQNGFQPDKRAFAPHITLAKKSHGGGADVSLLKEHYKEQQMMTVNKVVINQIFPEKIPKYQAVAVFDFQKKGGVGSGSIN